MLGWFRVGRRYLVQPTSVVEQFLFPDRYELRNGNQMGTSHDLRCRTSNKRRKRHRVNRIEQMEDRRLLAVNTVGLFANSPQANDGYTLIAPSTSRITYLIDQEGHEVNRWVSQYNPMASYLIGSELAASDETGVYEPGDMIRAAQTPNVAGEMTAPGASGRLELFSWYGDLKWQFDLNEVNNGLPNRDLRLHHDFEVMPNGNILAIAWQRVRYDEAVAQGRDPSTLQASTRYELWPDAIIEIDPSISTMQNGVLTSSRDAIVWQWSLIDHVVQDKYPNRQNYGSVSANPQRVDIKYIPEVFGAGSILADWTHFNGLDYNAELDQIVVSSREFSEFWVIDHSTTTAEARTESGGRSGMGGGILYRWGSPHVYDRGSLAAQQMRYQHDATWIDRDIDPGQNFLVFDNGWGRRGNENWSQVLEIDSPDDQQFYFNNRNETSDVDMIVFGTRKLNYVEDFVNLDNPWSASWLPVTGNWDGVGGDSAGMYDPENNVVLLTNLTASATVWTDLQTFSGPDGAGAGWKPISGDWNNDGADTVGFYNPATNTFYLHAGGSNWTTFVGPGNGGVGWLPIAGNWDGAGGDSVALYHQPSGQWSYTNNNATFIAQAAYGPVGNDWRPIAGDWNNNGFDTFGVYNPNADYWYLNNRFDGSTTAQFSFRVPVNVPYNWIPMAGDWNNDGFDTVGLYDPHFYTLVPNYAYAPYAAEWTYSAPVKSNFFARIISGAQRLPNGNTLINEGTEGRFFEVTPQGNIVWEYRNPLSLQYDGPPGALDYNEAIPPVNIQGIDGVQGNLTFRIYRYQKDYTPQFMNGDLDTTISVEKLPDVTYYDTQGLYDPVTNNWFLSNRSDGTIADMITFNANQNDPSYFLPLAGDWDGDGKDSVGVFDPVLGEAYISNQLDGSITGYQTIRIPRNLLGWKPVVGDWDNDGIDELGLYDPVSNDWRLNTELTLAAAAHPSGTPGPVFDWSGDIFIDRPGGLPTTWLPIAGNWDGLGGDTFGLYDPATNNWYLNNQLNGGWSTAIDSSTGAPYGVIVDLPNPLPSTWIPYAGDWNGNGQDTIGLYDPSNGTWYMNNKIDGSISNLIVVPPRNDPPNWIPVIGDWDGTGAMMAVQSQSLLIGGEPTVQLEGEEVVVAETSSTPGLILEGEPFVLPLSESNSGATNHVEIQEASSFCGLAESSESFTPLDESLSQIDYWMPSPADYFVGPDEDTSEETFADEELITDIAVAWRD